MGLGLIDFAVGTGDAVGIGDAVGLGVTDVGDGLVPQEVASSRRLVSAASVWQRPIRPLMEGGYPTSGYRSDRSTQERVRTWAIEARVAAARRGAGIADRRRIMLSPAPEPEQLALAM